MSCPVGLWVVEEIGLIDFPCCVKAEWCSITHDTPGGSIVLLYFVNLGPFELQ